MNLFFYLFSLVQSQERGQVVWQSSTIQEEVKTSRGVVKEETINNLILTSCYLKPYFDFDLKTLPKAYILSFKIQFGYLNLQGKKEC